jgi:hypothetical protein
VEGLRAIAMGLVNDEARSGFCHVEGTHRTSTEVSLVGNEEGAHCRRDPGEGSEGDRAGSPLASLRAAGLGLTSRGLHGGSGPVARRFDRCRAEFYADCFRTLGTPAATSSAEATPKHATVAAAMIEIRLAGAGCLRLD